ncbi:hypothetical protein AMK26_31850 [Streptomyces sp. CB03234]|uniref:hypothetical protein n=1 Tax=Streptomyces sp. (strain CB03234) TaxID=1703937 RepID=UPI000965ABF8|nr:hypothetical protein [Streptomyces sp. CB03234]OKJ95172.1 hypothetical protein AMK26_31850 [Streptomyces sp. CB03234]
MRATDLENLRPHLTSVCRTVTAASVALSGSLSRGEARIVGGRVLSDLDLIPVVAAPEDAALARKQLAPVLQELADRYTITCTAALTLEEKFLRVRHAGYVTSMATQPFVWDPLGVRHRLDAREDTTTRPADVLPWLAQPVTYYLAKAGATAPEENLAKAARAARRLLDAAGLRPDAPEPLTEHTPDHPPLTADARRGIAEACLRAVRDVAAAHGLTLLPSSREFLARTGSPHHAEGTRETFHAVRDRAFLENQGLPFGLSAMTARPTA